MGRGVRSTEDYCVVLLLGSKLSYRIHAPVARAKFNAATLAQIDLGAAVTKQVRGKPVADLRPVLDLCLNQDPEWRTTSRNALVNAKDKASKPIDVGTVHARRAFDLARQRDYPGAGAEIQNAIAASDDDIEKGYYKEILAEYTHHFDGPRAQEILLSAGQQNSQVLKPIAGVKYAKLTCERWNYVDRQTSCRNFEMFTAKKALT